MENKHEWAKNVSCKKVIEKEMAKKKESSFFCPFCSSPEFNLDDSQYCCYNCHARGDHVCFLMTYLSCSFYEAIGRLCYHQDMYQITKDE